MLGVDHLLTVLKAQIPHGQLKVGLHSPLRLGDFASLDVHLMDVLSYLDIFVHDKEATNEGYPNGMLYMSHDMRRLKTYVMQAEVHDVRSCAILAIHYMDACEV